MEFHEKLQQLRKQKGLTQEEVAQELYVSRTAVSKWESGRGYPNIESLKALARFYSVSVDELLSGEELLTVAEADQKQKESHQRNLVFGLLDCCTAMFLFLPFFGQRVDGVIQEVSLLNLTAEEPYIKIPYLILVCGMVMCGILTLAMQTVPCRWWQRNREKLSLGIGAAGALMFMISRQPYAAAFTFIFLVIKSSMLIKWP